MSLATQAKILRVIEDKRFERVGGEQVIKVDVRLIVASNKNLVDEVKSLLIKSKTDFKVNSKLVRGLLVEGHQAKENIYLAIVLQHIWRRRRAERRGGAAV